MNEYQARVILGEDITDTDELYNGGRYLSWSKGETTATLDDSFTADELEAIAWWMRNKS